MVTDWLASPYYGRQHMGTKGDNMKRDAWIFAGLVTVTVAGVVWLLVSKTIEIEVTLPEPVSSASAPSSSSSSAASKMKSFPPTSASASSPVPPPKPVLPPPNLYTSKDGVQVRDRVINLTGYYFPETEVRSGKFQLEWLAFGTEEEMVALEQRGQILPTYTPMMVVFADMTSDEIEGELGPYRKNSPRAFCKTYRITRAALHLECKDPQVGKVVFSGKIDRAFAAGQSNDNTYVDGTDHAVITGDLTVGGHVFPKVSFRYWVGD